MGERIYKILPAAEWQAAMAKGRYEGSAHDRRDGFIHFSTRAQAAETAAKHFAGQRDLLLLAVETADFGDDLKWEPSRGGALFPHLYGSLPVASVVDVWELPLEGGGHVFPPGI